MIVFGIALLISVIFLYFLGYIPGTLYYTRKRFINLSHHIKTENDCKPITYEYHVLLGLIKELLVHHGLDVNDDYYLSYVFQDVSSYVQRKCSKALECNTLSFDDIKCDKEDLKTFADYYKINLQQDQEQNIEFHDVEKNHKKMVYPCSISVYDDYYSNGYLFDINNVKKDGMCKREIVKVSRK